MSPWLRRHPIGTLLMVVGAVLAGSARIDGIPGYVAYGACLVPAIVQLYFRREES